MSQVTVEAETGVFIVNGDEMVETEVELADFYNNMVAHWQGAAVGETSDALIVNRVGSRDDKWSSTTAANLTYCVSTSFGSRNRQRGQRDGQRRRRCGRRRRT